MYHPDFLPVALLQFKSKDIALFLMQIYICCVDNFKPAHSLWVSNAGFTAVEHRTTQMRSIQCTFHDQSKLSLLEGQLSPCFLPPFLILAVHEPSTPFISPK